YLALIAGIGAVAGLGPVNQALGLGMYKSDEIGLAITALALVLMFAGSIMFPDRLDRMDRHERSGRVERPARAVSFARPARKEEA
ncbi:MAG: hypothetical protein OXS40_10260, partial [Gammaproteobacteria bacterium]|nr:hypothetical protein [Gammaproteobacteria bacterium]